MLQYEAEINDGCGGVLAALMVFLSHGASRKPIKSMLSLTIKQR